MSNNLPLLSLPNYMLDDIHIEDYYKIHDEYFHHINSGHTNFSVNFKRQHFDRLILSPNYNNSSNSDSTDVDVDVDVDEGDIVFDTDIELIGQPSPTMNFNPNDKLTIYKIVFCLENLLHIDDNTVQDVIQRLFIYVESNPQPTSLIVSVTHVAVYHGSLYEELGQPSSVIRLVNDLEIPLLRKIRVNNNSNTSNNLRDECCPICLVDYSGDVKTVTCMPCNHVFHDGCVLEWFKRGASGGATCPVCRFKLGDRWRDIEEEEE